VPTGNISACCPADSHGCLGNSTSTGCIMVPNRCTSTGGAFPWQAQGRFPSQRACPVAGTVLAHTMHEAHYFPATLAPRPYQKAPPDPPYPLWRTCSSGARLDVGPCLTSTPQATCTRRPHRPRPASWRSSSRPCKPSRSAWT